MSDIDVAVNSVSSSGSTVQSEPSHDQVVNIESSDRWSQRGLSSKVSISIDTEDNADGTANKNDRSQKKRLQCACLKKFVGNCLLPGVMGVYSFRQIDRLHHTHPISQELITNSMHYCSRVKHFLQNELLPEIKSLATSIYFPIDQIEAEGLSRLCGEIWAGTYLLLGIHKSLREADFHNIRSAYTSLAWDSAQTYRATLKFYRCLELFRSTILPLWVEIESIPGLDDLKNDFSDIDHPPKHLMSSKKAKKQKTACGQPLLNPLSTVRLEDSTILEHSLSLRMSPEKRSHLYSGQKEQNFPDIDYGAQVDVIKGLLDKPAEVLHNAPKVFRHIEPKLISENLSYTSTSSTEGEGHGFWDPSTKTWVMQVIDKDLTCSRALKILHASLSILYEEVDIIPSLHSEIVESVRGLAEQLHDFLGYADWIANKFSEFHSMLRLCYNFAVMCFDLDLPSFENVVKSEKVSEDVYALERSPSSDMLAAMKEHKDKHPYHKTSLEEDRMEYKVVSLTKLMMEASANICTGKNKQPVSEDFDWQDFYKTQYHLILQRLPLRVGVYLLKFISQPEMKLIIRQKVENAVPCSHKEQLTAVPGSFHRIKKLAL